MPAKKRTSLPKSKAKPCPEHKQPKPPRGHLWLERGWGWRTEDVTNYYVVGDDGGASPHYEEIPQGVAGLYYFEAVPKKAPTKKGKVCPSHTPPPLPKGYEWQSRGREWGANSDVVDRYYTVGEDPSDINVYTDSIPAAFSSKYYFEAVAIKEKAPRRGVRDCPDHTAPTVPMGHKWEYRGLGWSSPGRTTFYRVVGDGVSRVFLNSKAHGVKGFHYFEAVAILGYVDPATLDDEPVADRTGKPLPTTASGVLYQAASTIQSRGEERDRADGERSMAATVAAFNALFGTKLTETQGWRFMELLKMSRAAGGRYNYDDFLDGTAYAALAAECESKEQAQ